jgi:transposase
MQEVVPVKKKIPYRAVQVQSVDAARLGAKLGGAGQRCIVAIDVAKEAMVVGFANAAGLCESLVRFSHPKQTLLFLTLLEALRELGLVIEVALEPTGVYGDSLRYQLLLRDFPVYRVDPARSHAMKSVLDGVASVHDAKSCTLIAHLHAQGISSKWREKGVHEREMRALIDEHDVHRVPFERARGHLEAVVARHFPELSERVDSKCVWHLHLLERFPSPAHIAAEPREASELLRRVSRGRLSNERIDAIVNAARSSLGEPTSEGEARSIRALVQSTLELRVRLEEVRERIRAYVRERPELAQMVSTLGPVTTAVIIADLGEPSSYGSSAAFEKALGLNLKETSSGKKVGRLRITKRGPPRARRYLYLAALRLVHSDPTVRAWYEARTAYKAGHKLKAVVAVMRKLARAIVHLAGGEAFDAGKLFDRRRLELPTDGAPTSLAI